MDVAVVNLVLGTDDGLEFIKELKARCPELYAERLIKSGAAGFPAKKDATRHFFEAHQTEGGVCQQCKAERSGDTLGGNGEILSSEGRCLSRRSSKSEVGSPRPVPGGEGHSPAGKDAVPSSNAFSVVSDGLIGNFKPYPFGFAKSDPWDFPTGIPLCITRASTFNRI